MKTHKSKIAKARTLFVLLTLLVVGCKKDDDKPSGISEKTYGVKFDIIDEAGNNLVYGDSAIFNPDSIIIYTMDGSSNEWSRHQSGACAAEDAKGLALTSCRRVPDDKFDFTLRTLLQLNDTITDTIIVWSTNPVAAKTQNERVIINATYNSKMLCSDCDQSERYSVIKRL